VFLYLGRLKRDKGLLDLASAFGRAAAGRPELRLLVVGPDEDGIRGPMDRAAGAASSLARFVSYTDRPEDYMAAADVFCLPSYREGFGTTVIEAAAAGIPSIGSRIYGVVDAIEENVTGLLFTPGAVEELADCMLRVARDPELRGILGARARERVLRDFRADSITAELVGYYAAAIGRTKS
jgi:glycosyltransferase involved in cell wall biosynthesis